MLTITANDNKTWSYGYDEVGNKASLTRPNGTATVYDYDSLNRLKGMATRKGTLAQAVAGTSPLVSRFDYHVRADGRRDQLTEAIAHPDGSSVTRTVNYGFDEANRLTSEAGTNGEGKSYSKSYELDAAGNRKSLTENREGQLYARTTYGYNSLDWLTGTQTQTKDATSNVAYDYDANGAQVSQTTAAGTTGQKWDFEGHLLASGAVNAQGQWSGAKTTYTYDASGMRLSQASWNAAGVVTDGTSYVWDGDRVAEERDEKGVLQAVYEHGQELGPLRLTRRAGTVAAPVEQERYFIGDGQDSTRQLLDETGAVKDSYFYDAFGVSLPGGQGATENSFKYTGQQQDASGLYYLRARLYNAGTGRFLSHDPEMGNSDDPASMHRYLYAGHDPVNGVDPSGRSTEGLGGVISTIANSAVLSNMVFGAAISAVDTAMAGGSPGQVIASAAFGAATGGALAKARGLLVAKKMFMALRYAELAVPLAFGALGAKGSYDAFKEGNPALGFYRAFWALICLKGAKDAYKYLRMPDVAVDAGVEPVTNKVTHDLDPNPSRFADDTGLLTQRADGKWQIEYPGRPPEPVKDTSYMFIRTLEGLILVFNSSRTLSPKHADLAAGGDVAYAGNISFRSGQIRRWDNASGHYQPKAELSNQAGLPHSEVIKGSDPPTPYPLFDPMPGS